MRMTASGSESLSNKNTLRRGLAVVPIPILIDASPLDTTSQSQSRRGVSIAMFQAALCEQIEKTENWKPDDGFIALGLFFCRVSTPNILTSGWGWWLGRDRPRLKSDFVMALCSRLKGRMKWTGDSNVNWEAKLLFARKRIKRSK